MDGFEVIGEVLIGGLEMGLSGNSKKGCFIVILICLLLGVGLYFYINETPTPQVKGIITNKLTNDRVLVKTSTTEDVYTINHELYLNKNINDSIIIIK